MLREQIEELYPDSQMLFADGFDEAIIGVDLNPFGGVGRTDEKETNIHDSDERVVYSVKKMIDILMKNMSYEEAVEYLDFNTFGAYVGINTPVYCHDED